MINESHLPERYQWLEEDKRIAEEKRLAEEKDLTEEEHLAEEQRAAELAATPEAAQPPVVKPPAPPAPRPAITKPAVPRRPDQPGIDWIQWGAVAAGTLAVLIGVVLFVRRRAIPNDLDVTTLADWENDEGTGRSEGFAMRGSK